MKRWEMSRFDIILMVLNHGLVPVLRAGLGWEYIGNCPEEIDTLEFFLGSEEHRQNIIFLTKDIHELENKFGGKIKKSVPRYFRWASQILAFPPADRS